ncbi:Uncharacterised protein [Phocoenobacter uteri]|uniref:Uncharacterized protein n=1 Tax=Phocoenobacter uteri TaxID=146806 RepID=A0A379C9M0_9PAST|nr:hypothetical protein [Phocoenobacter uteri]MDG6880975.1 hypothetical protein [Phocoenobacter uteri]SUB58993.1 Uncharacterised protein [Phocoenobacter uteri]
MNNFKNWNVNDFAIWANFILGLALLAVDSKMNAIISILIAIFFTLYEIKEIIFKGYHLNVDTVKIKNIKMDDSPNR